MKSANVAGRYARALLSLAQDRGELDKVARDVESLVKLMESSEEFRAFIQNPVIPALKRKAVVEQLFKGKVDQLLYTFILLLVDKKRLGLLPQISNAFQKQYEELSGVLQVKLTSAYPLKKEQVEAVCAKLKKYFKKDIQPRTELDPGLLAGFKIQVNDLIYDLSALTQLQRFRQLVMTS